MKGGFGHVVENLEKVLGDIADASERKVCSFAPLSPLCLPCALQVQLVAVSKRHPEVFFFFPLQEAILAAYEAGQRVFGENYTTELLEKGFVSLCVVFLPRSFLAAAASLPKDIAWHLIGPVQSGKVGKLLQIPNLACVETLWRPKIARKFHSQLEERGGKLKVFVQINTSREDSKSGLEPEGASEFVQFLLDDCPNLVVEGLMTIGRIGGLCVFVFVLLVQCWISVC